MNHISDFTVFDLCKYKQRLVLDEGVSPQKIQKQAHKAQMTTLALQVMYRSGLPGRAGGGNGNPDCGKRAVPGEGGKPVLSPGNVLSCGSRARY